LSEHKPKAKPEQVKKTNSGTEVKEGSTSSQSNSYGIGPGEMAFASLQSAADTSSRSNGIAQLQTKANQSKSIFQLQAKADARSTRQVESIQNQGNTTTTTQLKGEMSSSGDHEFEQMGDGLGTKTVQLAKAETPAAAPNKPSGSTAVVQLEKDKEASSKGGFLGTVKRFFGLGQSNEKDAKKEVKKDGNAANAIKPDNVQEATNTPIIAASPAENVAEVSNPKPDDPKVVEKLIAEIKEQQTKIDGFNTTDFPYIANLNESLDRLNHWNLDSSTLSIIEKIKKSREKIPQGRKKILKKNNTNDKHPFNKDYSKFILNDICKESGNKVKDKIREHETRAAQATALKNEKLNFDEKSSIEILEATLNEARSKAEKLNSFQKEMREIRDLAKVERSMLLSVGSFFYENNPPTVEELTKELDTINSFVEHDFENWKNEKEEFKRLDEKSKAWFRSGLTKEEEAKLNSYKKDVFLNVSSDEISEGDIKASLKNMSSFSKKSKAKGTSANLEDGNSSKNENANSREDLEEQIELKKKEVKEKSSLILRRGADKEKSELAELEAKLKELIEKERFESLSPDEQEIELLEKDIAAKSSWIPGRGGAKDEKAKLAGLKTKLNEKKEKERFNKLSLSQQGIELKQKDIKEKSSWFLGLGATTEKKELANLLAKEKDEQERAQYNSLKELVYSPEENAAKQFIKKTEDILNLDWKSLEDKEKYYNVIKSDAPGKLDKLKPADPVADGASSGGQVVAAKGNLDTGKGLINGPEKSEATDSDSKTIVLDGKEVDENHVKELVKEEADFYTPIVMELYNTFSIISDLKKIKDGEMKLDAKEQAILTKKFASAAMYGMKISDNLLNHTAVSFAQIVPGLGLFIHIATAAATFFTKLIAVNSKETMEEFSQDFDDLNLNNKLLFEDDERGALLVKRNFRKVKPKFLEEADTYLEEGSENIKGINKKYGLKFKNNAELKAYVGQVQTRELIVKLHEINLKREVHSNWNMAAELAVVTGDISNMIAGGQLVAGLFYGAGGGLKLFKKGAVAANRAINGEENALNPFGENGMKHKEYVIHSKQIIAMYSKNLDLLSPENEEDKKKLSINVNVAEKVVVAAGAYPAEVYKEAGKDKKGYKAINKLVSAMKKGRS
jgi:hypothetical protein